MPVIDDPMGLEPRRGTIYPDTFKQGYEGRLKRGLTGPLGLTQFGVNVTTLEPGARSSERHWHAREDECVYILNGEVVLVTDEGEQHGGGLCRWHAQRAPSRQSRYGTRDLYRDRRTLARRRRHLS